MHPSTGTRSTPKGSLASCLGAYKFILGIYIGNQCHTAGHMFITHTIGVEMDAN